MHPLFRVAQVRTRLTESVSPLFVLRALTCGLEYDWGKLHTPIRALLFASVPRAPLFLHEDAGGAGLSNGPHIGTILWLGFARDALRIAPQLLLKKPGSRTQRATYDLFARKTRGAKEPMVPADHWREPDCISNVFKRLDSA